MKNKGLIIVGVIVVILLGIGLWIMTTNNSFITLEETIKQSSAEMDNQLKRRADLIPNLVNSVKGLTQQEQTIVNAITKSRENMLNGSTQDKLNASQELSKNISLLVENYPEIKSDTAFVSLMDELSGTENRITVARKKYNDTIATYNKKVKVFPSSIVAGMFNHETSSYLEIEESDKEVPEVKF